jgi:ElaB/YqjD/DUF883 family membrane-anchored ribosome-binding protein
MIKPTPAVKPLNQILSNMENKSSTFAGPTGHDAVRSAEQALTGLEGAVAQGEAALREAGAQTPERLEAARQRLASALEHAKVAGRRLRQQAIESAKVADRVVHDHPYHFFGIAVGVGLVVGLLAGKNGRIWSRRETSRFFGRNSSRRLEDARDQLASALDAAQDVYARVGAQARASVVATDRIVRDYVYSSAGVALGIGLVLGLAAMRVRGSNR